MDRIKSTVVNESPNPAGEPISEYPTVTSAEARAAVEAAHQAFQTWRDYPMRERARCSFDMQPGLRNVLTNCAVFLARITAGLLAKPQVLYGELLKILNPPAQPSMAWLNKMSTCCSWPMALINISPGNRWALFSL